MSPGTSQPKRTRYNVGFEFPGKVKLSIDKSALTISCDGLESDKVYTVYNCLFDDRILLAVRKKTIKRIDKVNVLFQFKYTDVHECTIESIINEDLIDTRLRETIFAQKQTPFFVVDPLPRGQKQKLFTGQFQPVGRTEEVDFLALYRLETRRYDLGRPFLVRGERE